MSTTITDRAALVLQQIDAALEMAEKATPGPWTAGKPTWNKCGRPFRAPVSASKTVCNTYDAGREHVHCVPSNESADATFIATSRTLLPTSLRCLKTAIEGLLVIQGNQSFYTMAERASKAIDALCDQWQATQ